MSSDGSIGEVDENDLEILEQGDIVEESENVEANIEENTENNTEEQEDAENKKTVKPKRIIKNPQPKLNERTLQEPKGLPALPGHFDKVKFKGRGHEEHDLNVLLKTYEYWCHRLIPKFSFDDCIARLETLGSKKATQTQLKRIRMGINLDTNDQVLNDDNEVENGNNEDHTAGIVDEPNNQFDQLLTGNNDHAAPQLSEEQMERIRQNKERAKRLREERLRNIKEKAQQSLQPSQQLIPQNSQSSLVDTDSNVPSTSTGRTHPELPLADNILNVYPSTSTGRTGEFDLNAFPSTSTGSATINEVHQRSCTEPNIETDEIECGEDNIDNILDFINTDDEPTSVKRKTLALDSDSEEEPLENHTVSSKRKGRRVLESDEEGQSDDNKNKTESEDQNMSTDLTDINTGDKSVNSDVNALEHIQPGCISQNEVQSLNDKSIENDTLNTVPRNDPLLNKNKNEDVGNSTTCKNMNAGSSNLDDMENDINIANVTHATETEDIISDKIQEVVDKTSMERKLDHEVSQVTQIDLEINGDESKASNKEQFNGKSVATPQVLTNGARIMDVNEPMDSTD